MKNKLLIILFCVSSFLFLDKAYALNTFSFSRVNYEIYDQNYEKISECTDSENFTTCDSGPSVPRIVMGLYNDSNSMTLVKDTEYTISIPANITYSSGSNVVVSISSISVQTTNDNWQVINFTNANYGGSSITFNYQPSSNIDIKGFVLDINFSPNAYYPGITITSPITYSLSKDYTGQLDNIQDELGNVKDELGQVGGNIQGSIEDSTNEIKDKLDESFNTCRDSYNLFNINNIKYKPTYNNVNPVLSIIDNNNFTMENNRTDDWNGIYVNNLDPTKTYTISFNISLISNTTGSIMVLNETGTPSTGRYTFNDNNSKYITKTFTGVTEIYILQSPLTKFKYQNVMLNEGSSAKAYEPYGEEICSNKLDDVNQSIGGINDYLNDDTPPDTDISSLGNVQGLLPPGPVDSLLNIPFKFLSVVNSSFGGVCKPLEGPFVYDSTLTLPCFSEVFYDEVPPLLLNFISLIPASWILISYLKHLYKKVNRAVSLETNADDEWGVL